MSAPFIAVSCNSYKNNVLSGFTRLQEQQEFVDLTLAADGYLVKVHKNIIALASPYLKKMIQSVPSPDPVIFLNNVNHNMLVYLLEYIYQGEVSVPQDSLNAFFQVSKALEIIGISQTTPTEKNKSTAKIIQPLKHTPVITLDGTCEQLIRPNNYAAHITINSDHNFKVTENLDTQILPNNVEGPQYVENIQVLQVEDSNNHLNDNEEAIEDQPTVSNTNASGDNIGSADNVVKFVPTNYDMELEQTLNHNENCSEPIQSEQTNRAMPIVQVLDGSNMSSETPLLDLTQPLNLDGEAKEALKIITQYSITERGALQIIVSRYIYCNHHSSDKSRKHRWRCSDYRKLRCPAFIDTLDNRIILRKGLHTHKYHDDKIYVKHKENLIFSSVQQAQAKSGTPQTRYTHTLPTT